MGHGRSFRGLSPKTRPSEATAMSRIETPAAATPSRRELERALARGRRLQGEALRDAFRGLFRVLVGGCSLRSLRLPGEVNAGRRSCC